MLPILLLFEASDELFEMRRMLFGREWTDLVVTFDHCRFFVVGCCCCCLRLQDSWMNPKRDDVVCMCGIAAVLLFA
jgi:multisubunit Na+/H+ antiporter MnhF subunit